MRDRLQFRSADDARASLLIATAIESLSSGSPPERSLLILKSLAQVPDNRTDILNGGAIPYLVEFIRSGSETVKREASAVLALLARDDGANIAIANGGAIPPLVALLGGTHHQIAHHQIEIALNIFHFLALNNFSNQVEIHRHGGLARLIQLHKDETFPRRDLVSNALSHFMPEINGHAIEIFNEFRDAFGEVGIYLMQAMFATTYNDIYEALNDALIVLKDKDKTPNLPTYQLNTVYRYILKDGHILAFTGRQFLNHYVKANRSSDERTNRFVSNIKSLAIQFLEFLSEVPNERLRDDWKKPDPSPSP